MTALDGKALLDHGTAIARRYAGRVGPDMAEELRAEAVMRALRSPPPDGRFEPWLERIFRNLVVDLWRRHHATVDPETAELGDTRTPEDQLLGSERRRVVRARLGELPRASRRALLSRFYAELDDGTTAERLGVSTTTVRTRIHRALSRLRVHLADLRAWFPALPGRVGAQVAAVGAAPIMVAALIVAGAAPEAAPTQATAMVAAAPARHAPGRVAAPARVDQAPVPPATAPARPTKRVVARIVPGRPPEPPAPLVLPTDEPMVARVLQPDGLDVFGEPEPPRPPCLVQAPPELFAQIEKMIEERL